MNYAGSSQDIRDAVLDRECGELLSVGQGCGIIINRGEIKVNPGCGLIFDPYLNETTIEYEKKEEEKKVTRPASWWFMLGFTLGTILFFVSAGMLL